MYITEFKNLIVTMDKLNADQLILYGVLLFQTVGIMYKIVSWKLNCRKKPKNLSSGFVIVEPKDVAVKIEEPKKQKGHPITIE